MESFESRLMCEQVQECLDEFLDHELPDDLSLEIEAHCAQCLACQEELLMTQHARSALKKMPMLSCPANVTEAALSQIKKEQRREQLRWRWPAVWKTAACSALVAALFLVAVRLPGSFEEHTQAPAEPGAQVVAEQIADAIGESAEVLAMVANVTSRDTNVATNLRIDVDADNATLMDALERSIQTLSEENL